MRNILFLLLLLPMAAAAQVEFKSIPLVHVEYYGVDTVKTILTVTKGKSTFKRDVPGYVLLQNKCPVGYLNVHKKPFPKNITVWRYWY